MCSFKLNNKGVTILEGLIALTLLALVATGTFSVLLSTSRKSSTPDIREEMVLAVDRAASLLQAYVVDANTTATTVHSGLSGGLCGGDGTPLASGGEHDIKCLLPPICDASQSSFQYTIGSDTKTFAIRSEDMMNIGSMGSTVRASTTQSMNTVTFNITCNGFTL